MRLINSSVLEVIGLMADMNRREFDHYLRNAHIRAEAVAEMIVYKTLVKSVQPFSEVSDIELVMKEAVSAMNQKIIDECIRVNHHGMGTFASYSGL